MAPATEVVRGEALPSRDSDLYSLAVLLFYMFIVHHLGRQAGIVHPLLRSPGDDQGLRNTPRIHLRSQDDSNRPDPAYHRNAMEYWPIYPQFLRDLFIRSFTEGLPTRSTAGSKRPSGGRP